MYEVVPETSVPQPSTGRPSPAVRRWRVWIAWIVAASIFLSAIYYGLQLRRWAWDQTTEVRFVNSVSNAIEWGRYANEVGVLNVYDKLVEKHGLEGDYAGPARFALDYAPLRLYIAAAWARWAQETYPPPAGRPLVWQSEYEFTRPMLQLNQACELLAAIGMFLLVYHWVRVSRTPAPKRWWSFGLKDAWGKNELPTRDLPSTVGLFSGLLAALLLWFNPAVIFNAHVYPQWDVWLLPAFIFAIYFGLRNWWLPAGIAVGICSMAKGQILFALPLLIAWPMLLGNVAGAARVMAGLVVGIALVVWPFLLQSYDASRWILYASIGAVMLAAVAAMPRKGWKWQVARGVLALVAISLVVWPVAGQTGEVLLRGTEITLQKRTTLLTVVALATIAAFIGGRRWIPTVLAGLPAACTLMTIPLLNATSAWFEIGIIYPTRHWKLLFWCHGANLGSLLQLRFQWKYPDVVDLSWIPLLGPAEPIELRKVMMAVYVVLLTTLILAFVRHRRRHDPKLLMALAVPFMLSYTFLPQMIERYLIWPAAFLSAYAAIRISGLALWLSVSTIATALMFGYMLSMPNVRGASITRDWALYIRPLFPDIGWAIIVLALVMLYIALKPTRDILPQPDEPRS